MSGWEQEEAEQKAYEAQMQAMYDERCREQQLSEQVTWFQEEVERLKAENDELRAKNERLRGERDHFREAWAAAQSRLDCGTDALEAVREERDAVVAWLREEYDTHSTQDAADGIERGEHRREEEP